MLKHLHLTFVALSLISFLGRVALTQFRPEMMQFKWVNITPHILNGFLLLTGFGLVIQGGWLSGEFGWIIAKLIALIGFVVLGVLTLKRTDVTRWYAFGGALLFFAYMVGIAVTKSAIFF